MTVHDYLHVQSLNPKYDLTNFRFEERPLVPREFRGECKNYTNWRPDSPGFHEDIYCLKLGMDDFTAYCLCLIPMGRKDGREFRRVGICRWNTYWIEFICPEEPILRRWMDKELVYTISLI